MADAAAFSRSLKLQMGRAGHWLKARTKLEKMAMGSFGACMALFFMWLLVKDHDTLFILAEVTHFAGLGVLGYKLLKERSCSGLSLKTQLLTLIFLAIRLLCSVVMESDIHTVLDLLTLAATGAVVYMMWAELKATYAEELDSLPLHWVLLPCLLLAIVAHPGTRHNIFLRVLWAACVYLEAVSVLPQLRMMQACKVVERHTANYVFCLGLARFLNCAHWILQLATGQSFLYQTFNFSRPGGMLWPLMVLISEIVQTFILADFCYYYIKSASEGGSGSVRLPSGVV